MNKRIFGLISVILALSFIIASSSFAVEKETTGAKVKSFWQKLFSYPAKAADESVSVVSEAAKGTTAVVTKEVTAVGQVTSGDEDNVISCHRFAGRLVASGLRLFGRQLLRRGGAEQSQG